MKEQSFLMGYEIMMHPDSPLRPTSLEIWDQNKRYAEFSPHPPFKYMNDALVGLAYHSLTGFGELSASKDRTLASSAFETLDPYAPLYQGAARRLKELCQSYAPTPLDKIKLFENRWNSFFKSCFKPGQMTFAHFEQGLDILRDFENSLQSTLIYNFSIKLSPETTAQVMTLYSLLFHLRTLVALDYNAHMQDFVFEGLRCDSISDYLPKADFTINDALLYWQFKKLATPFVGHKDKDVRIEKLLIEPLERAFTQFTHNACALINQLPQTLLTSCSPGELEDVLHHTQMDWLLGTTGGVLFRLREEMFGISYGYNKLFWPDALEGTSTFKPQSLKVCFELKESQIYDKRAS
jgi:hypothetical protein